MQRLAVLVDFERLQQQAQGQGGEVSYQRLLRQLAAGRPVLRAVAYLGTGASRSLGASLAANGFEVETAEDSGTTPVAIAVDAMAIGQRVDTVLLVPDAPTLVPLARALKGLGVRVETAGFGQRTAVAGASAYPHQVLGKECLFIP